MTVFELAQKYYPRLWSVERLNALLAAGKLTQEEYDALTSEEGVTANDTTGNEEESAGDD